jgi:hypothetical protein
MAIVHESSFVTTLHELERMERERAQSEARTRAAGREEQRARELRLERDHEDAERRRRWAEEDRTLAVVRERQQHEARLKTVHDATLEKTRLEAESRFERERLELVHAHELRMAEAKTAARVRWLHKAIGGLLGACVVLVTLGTTLLLDARAERALLSARSAGAATTARELEDARRELDRARERETLDATRLLLLQAKLDEALEKSVPVPGSAPPVGIVTPPRPRPEPVSPTRCGPGNDGDPLDGCVP